MTTLFDINDKIELTMRGTVHSFSISNNGDCYVIYLKDNKGENVSVYLDSDALILGNARKVNEKE